jgi:two-component system chemotaxis response regulator CheY
MRNIQKRALDPMGGMEYAEAADGLEALKCMETTTFDLVLVDWNMPNMDGLTLVKQIRLTNKTIPLMMVTTEAEKTRMLDAIKAGVNNYLVKPFTPEDLAKRVLETLQQLKAA